MTPDRIHDYEYELRNATERLDRDPLVRSADRKLIQAFLRHIRAQEVSTGRLAKYTNMLHTTSTLMRVPWRRAKRRDFEDLVTRLADREIVGKNGVTRHYSAEPRPRSGLTRIRVVRLPAS